MIFSVATPRRGSRGMSLTVRKKLFVRSRHRRAGHRRQPALLEWREDRRSRKTRGGLVALGL